MGQGSGTTKAASDFESGLRELVGVPFFPFIWVSFKQNETPESLTCPLQLGWAGPKTMGPQFKSTGKASQSGLQV